MAPFDELQKLWQNQAPPAHSVDGVALARDLSAFARRQRRILIAKSILVVAILAWSAIVNSPSVLRLAGLLVVGVAAFSLIAIDWRKQRQLASPTFAEPSLDFLRKMRATVLGLRDPFRGYHRAFLIATLTGLNLICLAARRETVPHRVLLHVASSAMVLIVYYAGIRFRRRRIARDVLVRRLETLIDSMENRSS